MPPTPTHIQGEGQPHLGLGHEFSRTRPAAQPDRGAQVPQGGVRIFQLQSRHAQDLLGYGHRCELMVLVGLVDHGPCQEGRLGWVRVNEPERLTGPLIQARAHNRF